MTNGADHGSTAKKHPSPEQKTQMSEKKTEKPKTDSKKS